MGVQTGEGDWEIRPLLADSPECRQGKAQGGVHRDGHDHGLCPGHMVRIERLDGEVARARLVAGAAQQPGPCGKAERLVAELVGREDEDPHLRHRNSSMTMRSAR
jgi:hypothetical protein